MKIAQFIFNRLLLTVLNHFVESQLINKILRPIVRETLT